MPNLPAYSRIDQLPRTTPLGVRFWDAATQTIVRGGLQVTAIPKFAVPQAGLFLRKVEAQPNSSGVYVLHTSPYGADPDFAFGEGDDAFWAKITATRQVDVTVLDLEQRFVPVQFTAAMPQRGVYALDCPDLLAGPTISAPPETTPLFSAASRPPPAGSAVVRAELRHIDGKSPAAWALLEVYQETSADPILLGSGLADSAGQLVVFFPYPTPEDASGAVSLHLQQWTLSFKVYFAEGAELLKTPDLCQIYSQPKNSLWADLAHSADLETQTLTYGQECILRTAGKSWVDVGH